jgi:ribose transport system ATP-binding protein
VAENVMLGQWPSRGGFVRWRKLRAEAARILHEMHVELDLDAPAESLGVAERQLIEIARALVGEARCLILDEPTAALSHQEVERLFEFIGRLRARGAAIIYITHRLDEVVRIADRVQVLRDGASVLEGLVADHRRHDLVTAMVGKAIGAIERPAPLEAAPASALLTFEGASSGSAFRDLDLTVGNGEVVGLYGKIGSGTAEVAEVAFGIRRLTAGQLRVAPGGVGVATPAQAIRAGIGFLPADRQRDGAFMVLSVAKNLSAPSWRRLARAGTAITARDEATAYRRWHNVLGVRSRNDPEQPIGTLSGGNQQKVLLGRWLESGSRVLVLVEPTRGVDVGARAEIYRLLRSLAADGVGVLVVTSDHEEVVQLADRAVVMSRGAVSAHFAGDQVTVEHLASAAGD